MSESKRSRGRRRSGSAIGVVAGAGLIAALGVVAFSDQPVVVQTHEQVYEGPSIETARLQKEVERLKSEVEELKRTVRRLESAIASAATGTSETEAAQDRGSQAQASPGVTVVRQTQRFEGHTGPVRAVAVSPDGRLGASTGDDGTVRLWDLRSYRRHTVLLPPGGPGGQLVSLAFSSDGKFLAAGGSGLFLFRAEDGALLREFRTPGGWTHAVAFSRDGRMLASAGGNTVRFWDTETGRELKSSVHQMDVTNAVDLARDGRVLCAGGYYNSSSTPVTYFARLWNADTGREEFRLGYPVRTTFRDAVLIANDARVLTAGPSGRLQEWEVASGEEGRHWGEQQDVNCLAVSSDRRYVATGGHGVIRLWDAEQARVLDSVPVPGVGVYSIGLSGDGRRALFAGLHDRSVRSVVFRLPQAPGEPVPGQSGVSEASGPRPELRLKGHTSFVYAVAVSPDGKQAASGGFDGTLRRWDLESGREIGASERVGIVNDLAYTPDGRYLLLACGQTRGTGSVRVWDVAAWRQVRLLKGHDHAVHGVAVSPDGGTAASGSLDTTVVLWDLATGEPRRTLTGHTNGVTSVAFSPDGRTVASAGIDGSARVWDVDTGRQVREFGGGIRIADFFPDRPELLTAGPGGVLRVWHLETGRELRRLADHGRLVGNVLVSSGGRRVLSGGADGTVRLTDSRTGRELYRVPSTDHPDGAIALTPAGDRVITVDSNHVLNVWGVPDFQPDATAQAARPDGARPPRPVLVAPRP